MRLPPLPSPRLISFLSYLLYSILFYSSSISNHNIFFSVDEIPASASATMKSLEASKAVASAAKAKTTQSKAVTGEPCSAPSLTHSYAQLSHCLPSTVTTALSSDTDCAAMISSHFTSSTFILLDLKLTPTPTLTVTSPFLQ